MSVPNRKDARAALAAAIIADAGITALVPAANIIDYKPTNPDKRRIIGVQSLSSSDPPATQKYNKTEFGLAIIVLVLLASSAASGVTEEQAEDLMDDINQAVRQFLQDKRGKIAGWLSIERDGESIVEDFKPDAGGTYIQESFPVKVNIL